MADLFDPSAARGSPLAPSNLRGQVLVGLVLAVAALAAFLAGRLVFSVFAGALLVLAYSDLRRALAPWGHAVTFVLGAAGVAGFLYSGYVGRLDMLPAAAAALVLALLVTRVAIHEAQGLVSGTTGDVAATLGAAAAVGVLGAHVLLIRAVPRFGGRGLIVFGAMVLLNDAAAFAVGRWRGRHRLSPLAPDKTWEGALAGFAASVLVGVASAFVADPPFDLSSGLAFGAGIGVLAPVGDLAFSALKRSAGRTRAERYLGPMGGALDVVDGVVFAAPAFYWAFRTIAL